MLAGQFAPVGRWAALHAGRTALGCIAAPVFLWATAS
jgi:hypothetical protein